MLQCFVVSLLLSPVFAQPALEQEKDRKDLPIQLAEASESKDWLSTADAMPYEGRENSRELSREKLHLWLIGGGSQIQNAKGPIEQSLVWQRQVLQKHWEPESLQVLFGSGESELPDVLVYEAQTNFNAGMAPLALVFDGGRSNGFNYKHHELSGGTQGSTRVENLKSHLTNHLIQLNAGDSLFLSSFGHGRVDREDIRNNALVLWDNSTLSVRQLDEILNVLPPEIPVRLLLSQCHSGAFANLIYRQSDQKMGMSTYQRCGFFASSAFQLVETCAAKVGLVDEQDYMANFYAAINGQTRAGEPLKASPDRDGNGRVSLREAHFFALEFAYSANLSRSTSEVFLENWQPWYTKWHSSARLPDNEYGRLAERLAKQYNVSDSAALLTQRAAVQFSLEALHSRLEEQRKAINELQLELQARLIKRWPALETPYTDNYRQLLIQQLPAINRFLLEQSEYSRLVTQYQDKENLKARILDTNRQLTQYEKIRRMRKLARLLANFEILGNDVRQREYQRLVNCESAEPSS